MDWKECILIHNHLISYRSCMRIYIKETLDNKFELNEMIKESDHISTDM